jgi:hypothetical protein
MEFVKFSKIPRLANVGLIITEKLDGTNGQVTVPEDPTEPLIVGSRNRFITPGKTTDNYGFAQWVVENEATIRQLAPGTHYGEWWGQGIARKYNMDRKVWSLFRYGGELPEHPQLSRVPVLLHRQMAFDSDTLTDITEVILALQTTGSVAAPGFMEPEGVVVTIDSHRYKIIFDKRGPSPEETTK